MFLTGETINLVFAFLQMDVWKFNSGILTATASLHRSVFRIQFSLCSSSSQQEWSSLIEVDKIVQFPSIHSLSMPACPSKVMVGHKTIPGQHRDTHIPNHKLERPVKTLEVVFLECGSGEAVNRPWQLHARKTQARIPTHGFPAVRQHYFNEVFQNK